LSIEEISRDREIVREEIMARVAPEFNKVGMEPVSANITDIRGGKAGNS